MFSVSCPYVAGLGGCGSRSCGGGDGGGDPSSEDASKRPEKKPSDEQKNRAVITKSDTTNGTAAKDEKKLAPNGSSSESASSHLDVAVKTAEVKVAVAAVEPVAKPKPKVPTGLCRPLSSLPASLLPQPFTAEDKSWMDAHALWWLEGVWHRYEHGPIANSELDQDAPDSEAKTGGQPMRVKHSFAAKLKAAIETAWKQTDTTAAAAVSDSSPATPALVGAATKRVVLAVRSALDADGTTTLDQLLAERRAQLTSAKDKLTSSGTGTAQSIAEAEHEIKEYDKDITALRHAWSTSTKVCDVSSIACSLLYVTIAGSVLNVAFWFWCDVWCVVEIS